MTRDKERKHKMNKEGKALGKTEQVYDNKRIEENEEEKEEEKERERKIKKNEIH